jgi:diguanylate cyclase (GGDEF)-like protein
LDEGGVFVKLFPIPASIGRLPRLGIVAHLGLGFLAVAALAIAANLFAEHGTVFVTGAPQVVERIKYVSAPVPTPATPRSAGVPALPSPLDASRLKSALDEMAQATLAYVDKGGDAAVHRLTMAAGSLDVEASSLGRHGTAAGLSKKDAARLRSMSNALAGAAREAGEAAESRRNLAGEYRAHFDAIESRMTQATDGAWKIFGRVIARESIVELERRVGEIRRHLGEVDQASEAEAFAANLEAAEAAFIATLEKRAASLAASQGGSWVAQMREDGAELASIRQSLARVQLDLRQGLDSFSGALASLHALVSSLELASARFVSAGKSAGASVASPAVPPVAVAVPGASPPSAQPVAQVPAPAMVQSARSRLVAGTSIAVLVILVILSTWMALRVIGPVRRLAAATRRLAQGQHTRVTRGGILELDELGASFNEMAEHLEEARAATADYQKLLEARVLERTRQLKHLAEHDPLTELPNRRQLFAELAAALDCADPSTGVIGVLAMDLDNFKNINDTMGHAYGDRVLQGVAQRLDASVASRGFSARQGGDEFTIVCNRADRLEELVAMADEILAAFQAPLEIDGRELAVSVSLGIAAFPTHASDAESLLRAADAALFRAKALGRHRSSVFSADLLDAAASRFRTEQGLRQAIERGEFELAFQPEVAASTFEVPLVEALLRWRLPDGRLASPDDFLAVAEESGLVVEISDWVLQSAIAAVAGWRRDGWQDLRVAINVSPRQVAAPNFLDRVVELLDSHGLPPGCIEIELTEHVLQTGEATIETLRALRKRGIGIALDDFGTGYSTLASLEQLPFTRVKLDRSLITRIDSADRSLAIAQTIIDLCERLGLEITAEGVERVSQLEILARAPGLYVQGYLLSRPLPLAAVRRELASLPDRLRARFLASGEPVKPRGRRAAAR